MRRVETEGTRFEFRDTDIRVIDTGIHQAVTEFLIRVGIDGSHTAFRNIKRLFNRLSQTRPAVVIVDDTINDDFDSVFVIFVELRELIQCIDDSVDPGASKTNALVLLRDMLESTLLVNDDWLQNHQSGVSWQCCYLIDNRIGRLPGNRLTAYRTVGYADTRKQ